MNLTELPGFDAVDFQRRWAAARLSSLRAVLGVETQADEDALLTEAEARDPDAALRAVFDASRALGRSAARHFQVSFESADLAALLSGAGPCFRGAFAPTATALRLERHGCDGARRPFLCDFWREAADGLVMGAGDEARLARHQSFGHGDAACVDVLFDDGPEEPALGPLPDAVRDALAPVVRLFQRLGAPLALRGVSEGVLHYQLDAEAAAHERFAAEVKKRLPHLALKDVSPTTVLTEGSPPR